MRACGLARVLELIGKRLQPLSCTCTDPSDNVAQCGDEQARLFALCVDMRLAP